MEALNAICPYFTMFPLEFPQGILERHASRKQTVLDPFAGRGTTVFAARINGLTAYGIDTNPVAVAISQAKLVNVTPAEIVAAANKILGASTPKRIPPGPFWRSAFQKDVLHKLCTLRENLIENCRTPARKALRAVILGGLHGPLGVKVQSYFSNQCPRTYAPKPDYAVKFWRSRKLTAPTVDVIDVITRRAERAYHGVEMNGAGGIVRGDSRKADSYYQMASKADWIITSPPYYGMRTYVSDQWIRNWFLGGPEHVDYSPGLQLPHSSQDDFCAGLASVWKNCRNESKDTCRLVIRFGAINDRKVDVREIIKRSLKDTGWRIRTCHNAGVASGAKRQANQFVPAKAAITEYDVWAIAE